MCRMEETKIDFAMGSMLKSTQNQVEFVQMELLIAGIRDKSINMMVPVKLVGSNEDRIAANIGFVIGANGAGYRR